MSCPERLLELRQKRFGTTTACVPGAVRLRVRTGNGASAFVFVAQIQPVRAGALAHQIDDLVLQNGGEPGFEREPAGESGPVPLAAGRGLRLTRVEPVSVAPETCRFKNLFTTSIATG